MPGKLFHYMQGYLRIRISGYNVERFINACSHRKIILWNLSPSDNYYEMNITIKDFKNLKPVIRKTRTKVMIVERAGFPFFLKNYYKRYLFFVGFICCILIIMSFSTFIWNIQIKGNFSYSTENILEYLSSIDVNKGMKINEVDCNEISRKIRQKYNDIIWVSSSIVGTNIIINIKENDESKNVFKNKTSNIPYDIIADDNLLITRIVIRNGILKVKTGEIVKKGDLLVSGQIPVYNDAKEIIKYQYCISDADIYGKKTIDYEETLKLSTYNKIFQNIQKTEYFLKIGKHRFCFGSIKNQYDHFEEVSKEVNKGIFSYGYRKVRPYLKTSKYYSKNEVQKILTSNFNYYCQELKKKGVVILKNNVKIYTWSDKAKAAGTLTIEKPVGHNVKSELLETGDYIDGNDGNNN